MSIYLNSDLTLCNNFLTIPYDVYDDVLNVACGVTGYYPKPRVSIIDVGHTNTTYNVNTREIRKDPDCLYEGRSSDVKMELLESSSTTTIMCMVNSVPCTINVRQGEFTVNV